jgi:hypothetical protein
MTYRVLDLLRYRDHKDKHVRRAVIQALPRLAAGRPDLFVTFCLHTSMMHLFEKLKDHKDRIVCFAALGDLAAVFRKFIEC